MADKISDEMKALDEAITEAGGVGALAERIGVVQSVVSMWKQRGKVPARYAPDIEATTGITCERLCPKVNWGFVRNRRTQQGQQAKAGAQ